MKVMYPVALLMATTALLGSSVALQASETDDRIESSFKNSAVYKTSLKDDHVVISSKDGAVTLSGDVCDETHKPMAQDTAKALPGVTSVDNRIIVLPIVLPNVRAHATGVSVIDPTRRVPFRVNDVKGEMPVAKAPEPLAEPVVDSTQDASITADVKKSLSSHRWTKALDTKVTTINGVVSIGGKASNSAQKDSVTKLVTDVKGVKSVVNHMIIEQTLSKNE